MPINDPRADPNYKSFEAGGRQAARESVAVHGLLLGHEEEQTLHQYIGGRRLQRSCSDSSIDAGNLQSQRRIQPGRSHLGLGCQVLWVPTSSRPTCWCRRTSTISAATRSPGKCNSRGGATIPSIVLNVEPIGTRRLPNINLLTLRVEKTFRCGGRAQAGGPTQCVQCAERELGDQTCNGAREQSSCGPRPSCCPALRK